MAPLPPPLAFLLVLFSGWVNRQQQAAIDYLLEENRILRALNGARRLRLTVVGGELFVRPATGRL